MMNETISANFDGQQLFAIVETRIEKYPYAEENDEYMPDFLRVYSESTEIDYDPQADLIFDSWEELIRCVYERRREQPPVPVRSFDELLGQEMNRQEAEKLLEANRGQLREPKIQPVPLGKLLER
jgi:hypothetical protein